MLEGMTALVFATLVFHLRLTPDRIEDSRLIDQYRQLSEAVRSHQSDQAETAMKRLLASGRP